MYKLIAKQSNGVTFVTNSNQITDLQRIAGNLKYMASYQILKHDSVVYEMRAGL